MTNLHKGTRQEWISEANNLHKNTSRDGKYTWLIHKDNTLGEISKLINLHKATTLKRLSKRTNLHKDKRRTE